MIDTILYICEVKEDQLGYLDVKSGNSSIPKGIYFYVQRGNNALISKDGVLRFPIEILNIGKAMSIPTGVFTAPRSGVYSFSFAIAKETFKMTEPMYIYLRVNGVKVGFSSVSAGPLSASAVMSVAVKLKKGERVDLWKGKDGTLANIYCGESPCHHFAGWLLEELE